VDGPAFTSVFQGSIRHNTFAGLAACAALYGPPGVALAAAAIAVLILIVNLLSVGVLSHFSPGSSHGLRRMLVSVLLNPLILACAAGIFLNMTETGLRYGSDALLEALGRAALPLGLLSVGAGLGGFLGRAVVLPLAVSAGNKLLLLPLVVLLLCRVTQAGAMETAVAVLFAALPAPASAYVLAGQFGGDARLMAALITGQTLLAAVTLPAVVAWSARWI
jgi:malonate transporter